jgi:hypothetical protein
MPVSTSIVKIYEFISMCGHIKYRLQSEDFHYGMPDEHHVKSIFAYIAVLSQWEVTDVIQKNVT